MTHHVLKVLFSECCLSTQIDLENLHIKVNHIIESCKSLLTADPHIPRHLVFSMLLQIALQMFIYFIITKHLKFLQPTYSFANTNLNLLDSTHSWIQSESNRSMLSTCMYEKSFILIENQHNHCKLTRKLPNAKPTWPFIITSWPCATPSLQTNALTFTETSIKIWKRKPWDTMTKQTMPHLTTSDTSFLVSSKPSFEISEYLASTNDFTGDSKLLGSKPSNNSIPSSSFFPFLIPFSSFYYSPE